MMKSTSDARTLTEVMGDYLSGLKFEDLPPAVIKHARLAVLDTVGAAIYGITTEEGEKVLRTVNHFASDGPATIWGTVRRTAVPFAALVNGTAAHARELDDFGGCGHTGAVVVPAVLAVAEFLDSSGRDVLTAVAAGYEVASRVLDGSGGYPAHNQQGWHSTSTCGSFGAAAGAAYLMGLADHEIAMALGIAGSYTGGLWAFIDDGAMTKRLHPGKAAETGVVAAFLARSGFSGPRFIFEAEWGGFFNTYMPGKYEPEAIVDGLGTEFRILRSGFKPHACCRGVHAALDALSELINQHHLQKDMIDRIEVITSLHAQRQLGKQEVANVVDAQLSIPYSMAIALLSGSTGPEQYTEERIADPEVQAWCRRITVQGDKQMVHRTPPLVRVYLSNGIRLEASVTAAKGAPENPMSEKELESKFIRLVQTIMTRNMATELSQCILHLEEMESIGQISRLLTSISITDFESS